MNDLVISSKQNNIVKMVRGLRDKKTREQEGCFVVEGFKSVDEAVQAGAKILKFIISERGERNLNTVKNLLNTAPEIVRVTDAVMNFMSETEAPQGVLALVSIPRITLEDIDASETLVIIDGVQDPGNVGTIIRSADAFGAGAVILTKGSADVFGGKTIRATMGSLFHLPVLQEVNAEELVRFLKSRGYFIAATTLQETSRYLPEVDLKTPLALVFGSEGKGVSATFIQSSDLLLKVPMVGSAESLNVAVTSGIVLYETSRRLGTSSNL